MKYVRLGIFVLGVCGSGVVAYADAFEDGLGAAKSGDFAMAHAKWQALAEQGHVLAQFNLGIMYARGRGVTQDIAKALQWYHAAAKQGYADAQLNLGVLYNSGQGVAQSYFEAAHWFRLAAEQGAAKAHFNLGLMHTHGRGVPQDYVLAYTCFTIAEAYGYDKAVEEGARLERHLTTAQREEAQTLAFGWRPGKPLPMRMSASAR